MKLPQETMKLLYYSPFETYLIQVQLAPCIGGWSAEDTGVQVVLALEGKVLQVLMDLQALQRRFGEQVFTDDAWLHAARAGRERRAWVTMPLICTFMPDRFTRPLMTASKRSSCSRLSSGACSHRDSRAHPP